MTERPVAALIPPPLHRPAVPGPAEAARGASAFRLPVAPLPALPDEATAGPVAVYGMGRIDASGRVFDRSILPALDWQPGQRLTLTVTDGAILARRDQHGAFAVPNGPYLTIPARLRQRSRISTGDRLLLAALPHADALLAYPLPVLDQILTTTHTALLGGEPS